MESNRKSIFIKITFYVLIFFTFVIGVLLYSASEGIPFVEGNETFNEGAAYNFVIGMNKKEALNQLKKHYNNEEIYVRIYWSTYSEINANELEAYAKNEKIRPISDSHIREYQVQVTSITNLTQPMTHINNWEIRMPKGLVNSIYLTFSDEKLITIQRSRWLFERP